MRRATVHHRPLLALAALLGALTPAAATAARTAHPAAASPAHPAAARTAHPAATSTADPAAARTATRATTPATTTLAKTASSSVVSASMRYVDGSKAEEPVWSNIRVSITRNGQLVTDAQPLPEPAAASYFHQPTLLAADLSDDDEPEVVVDVFTAGYDSSRRSVILHWDGHGYGSEVVNWGPGGYRLANVTGGPAPEFLSSDARFAELYGSSARGPLRVMAFDGTHLVDVSKHAAAQVRRDARRQSQDLRHARRTRARTDTRATVAAYVVDLVRLGRVREARRAIRLAARKGELHGSARAFARRVDGRMVAWGYTRGRVLG